MTMRGRAATAEPQERRLRAVRLTTALAIATGCVLPHLLLPATGLARDGAEEGLTLRARDTVRLDALEPTSSAAHWTQTARRPVTDMVVRLRAWPGRSLDAALASPGDGRSGPDKALFAAELIVAAAGRIHVEDRALCGHWKGDTAICRTECDGGAFALVRRQGLDGRGFALHIGRVAAVADAGFGDTVRLGACSDTHAPGGLAVKAGHAVAEILLDPR